MKNLEELGKLVFASVGVMLALFLVASTVLGALLMVAELTGGGATEFLCRGAS